MKNYALFSNNGRFIGFTSFKPQNGLYKEMPDNFDPVLQVYVGDYETGQLKTLNDLQIKDYREANVDKKWKVFETQLNDEVNHLITQRLDMPLYKQLNAIMETLYLNRDKIQLSENFEVIYNTIQSVRHNHKNGIKVFQEAPKADFISKEQERDYIEEYTQRQLSINDEAPTIKKVEDFDPNVDPTTL
jgi:hypothetical protein